MSEIKISIMAMESNAINAIKRVKAAWEDEENCPADLDHNYRFRRLNMGLVIVDMNTTEGLAGFWKWLSDNGFLVNTRWMLTLDEAVMPIDW